MAGAPKRSTHEVVHARLYLSVENDEGKRVMQHVPKGTGLTFTESQANNLVKSGKIKPVGNKKPIDMTDKEK